MLIEGPLTIAIGEPADGQGKVLTINFDPEFQNLSLERQGARFGAYIQELEQEIAARPDSDRNKAGMLIVQQFAEQLLPHVVAGELAMEEPMIVQIRQEAQAGALVDLLAPGQ